MLRHSELRQAAQLMIRRHGTGATIKAGFRAASLMDSGEAGAAAISVDIISEINRIRAELRDHYSGPPLDPPNPTSAAAWPDRVCRPAVASVSPLH